MKYLIIIAVTTLAAPHAGAQPAAPHATIVPNEIAPQAFPAAQARVPFHEPQQVGTPITPTMPLSVPQMLTRSHDSRDKTQLISRHVGEEPLVDNQLEIITQVAVQDGPNNSIANSVSNQPASHHQQPTGAQVGAATQLGVQIGAGNYGQNNAQISQQNPLQMPSGTNDLVNNNVFVGTQVGIQFGSDNKLDNSIIRQYAPGKNK